MPGLTIAGLVPMSTVDWPGTLSATVFLQGCPWRCTYCHNTALLDPRAEGKVTWEQVLALLQRRRGLLDAVVFSGGEATRQAGLVDAAAQVKAMGFRVGLHTAGAHPARLAAVLEQVDWVGLDLKCLPATYPQVVGVPGPRPGRAAWQCLDLVQARAADDEGFTFEVRTTVADEPTAGDALAVARTCRERGVAAFALQEARPEGMDPAPAAALAHRRREPQWARRWQGLVTQVRALDFPQLSVRAA